jgi:NAD(P)-dependent dehydrogenase (short-subunit alcohol dehydrogenase family)
VSTFNRLVDQTLADWRWVLGVNLWGVVHGVSAFLPIMRTQGTPAHIVNTSSIAGLWSGVSFIGPYAVSKVGVVSLSETLHAELRSENVPIGVSVLCPSSVDTNVMEAERNRPPSLGSEQRTDAAEHVRLLIRGGLSGDDGKSPADVAAMTLDAIRRDRFWIITHASARPGVEARFESILADLPDA